MTSQDKARQNLRNRIAKARKLNFTPLSGRKGEAFTRGSEMTKYHVMVAKSQVTTSVGSEKLVTHLFACRCKEDEIKDCKGNGNGTVCYHCLGWVRDVLSKSNLQIAFHADILSAIAGLNFGGQLVKIVSAQGNGVVWGVLSRKKVVAQMTNEQRINVLRGNKEEQEGID